MVKDCIQEEKTQHNLIPNSPSMTKRVLEHKIDVENKIIDMEEKIEDNTWKSACLVCNKNAVNFFTQVAIISGVMMFSIYKLSTVNTPEQETIYLSLLSACLGILSPQPMFK